MKQSLFGFCLVLIFLSGTMAQDNRPAALNNRPEKIDFPDKGIDVPMKMRGGMPAIDVKVNGQGPFLFGIDTGGMGLARADLSLVKKLDLEKVGVITAGDGSGKNSIEMNVVQFDTLEFGGATFSGVRAPSRNYNRSATLKNISGILGIHLFQDHLLVLDYQNKKVKVLPGKLNKPDDKTVFAAVADVQVPTIELMLGKKKVAFHLDSGNMGGFTLPAAMQKQLEFAAPPVQIGEARTVANTFKIKQGQLKDSFLIGRHEFQQPTFNLVEFSISPNIGAEVLKYFTVTFDQKNRRVQFERKGEGPIQAKPKARIGLGLGRQGNKLLVGLTLPDSPAAKSGLKVGDQILKINGMDAEKLGREQLGAILTSGRAITFTVKRDDNEKEFVVDPNKK